MTKPLLSELSDEDIRNLDWYYKMELRPGVFTNGTLFENIRATTSMMRRVDVKDLRALDIGAQEGAQAVLLAKAGADVTAYDRRRNGAQKLELVKQAFGVDFECRLGQTFHEFAKDLTDAKTPPFEYVLFSGVLYHVINPALFLWYIRCLTAPGSIMVMETSMAVSEEPALFFNAAGRFSNMTNYYQVSSEWLDCMLRYLGIRIVDVEYVSKGSIGGQNIVRCALLCLIDDRPQCDADDAWGPMGLVHKECSEYLRLPLDRGFTGYLISDNGSTWPNHHSRARPKSYAADYFRNGIQSLDLTKVLRDQQEVERDPEASVRRLTDSLS